MSVINQMLKDLEQRNAEQSSVQQSAAPVQVVRSSKKHIFIIIFIVVLLNALGLFVWQLYSENQRLKNEGEQTSQPKVVQVTSQNKSQERIEKASNNNVIEETSTSADTTSVEKPTEMIVQKVETLPAKLIEPTITEPTVIEPSITEKTLIKPPVTNVETAVLQSHKTEPEIAIIEPAKPKIAPANVAGKVTTETPKASFSISRRQLTSTELAKQKMQQAEKALNDNNSEKAEQLFEDVLMLQPTYKEARKKLAALWFGRQAFQPAINVLSQGIALDPNDSDFRLMKARIYLNAGNANAALNTLHSLPDTPNKEYQLLMANVAQQSENYTIAVSAYKKLLALEPNSSRWWLGLAVAYDSNSEFEQASSAYQSALKAGNLSSSSINFAEQRLQELGE